MLILKILFYLLSGCQDFLRAVIGAALYLITSIICVIGGGGDGARIAGGVSEKSVELTLAFFLH